MKTKTNLFLLFIVLLLSGCSNSSSTNIVAQEKCSQSAKDFFNNNITEEFNKNVFNYTNHYNQKLNKCLIMITKFIKGDHRNSLYDVYENNHIGEIGILGNTLTPQVCYVGDNMCKSSGEFKEFAKPYMEK